ncbi:glycoside hydrolase family 44 protein [Parabacteroides sp. FAFU027]|uniref:glycoside hydrolase family 44 protein n=1 Tax=Parabacteroides sp. FAFU027 TaxID=2922715 RepID=UPI001FB000BC|nr:glycoside hydrolase family 44 protein [Parabacteroides sp. FAFU027]
MKLHVFKNYFLLLLLILTGVNPAIAQDVNITVDASVGKRAVSPYIYGANNWFDKPAQFYKDAGLTMARTNGGNNATKYNWRKKISSHPDWYNNVYVNDWDKTSQNAATNLPNLQVMWAFQLIGRVASNTNNNFNDWAYNQSAYWSGVNQNLAGGGTPNTTGVNSGKAAVEGNINLYTQPWPADSTVEILNHFFQPKPQGLGLNQKQFVYWNMDNEVDVWNGTHDDVMPTLIAASVFMDNYIATAKKAKAICPEIKLCGPVATSEWQWFKWGSESIKINGKYYSWLEYFIKRCADEEKASGVRVLDVVDLHNYAYAANDSAALQIHRMYYDQTYDYPGANGIYTMNGGWDTRIKSEYIFKRINDWLTTYYGANHGITCGVSEWHSATDQKNANSTAVVYASHLGTFANNGVELFTPWSWYPGMWETLHLFSRYAKKYSVSSVSSTENTVSAYTTVSERADSMTVILVNRDMVSSRTATINLNNFAVSDGNYSTLQLSSLPTTETFKSHTNNALKLNSATVNSNSFTITVPALSVTAVLLKSTSTGISQTKTPDVDVKIYPNPASDNLSISMSSNIPGTTELIVYDQMGRRICNSLVEYDGHSPITMNVSELSNGFYFLSIKSSICSSTKTVSIFR